MHSFLKYIKLNIREKITQQTKKKKELYNEGQKVYLMNEQGLLNKARMVCCVLVVMNPITKLAYWHP